MNEGIGFVDDGSKSVIECILEELHKHDTPRFRDRDREDRGALNCKCGSRFEPTSTGIRDWVSHYKHWAEEIAKAVGS